MRLDALTSLRFLAAGLVVLHHAVPAFLGEHPLANISRLGYVGVAFFFALSGFVLTWSWRPDLPRRFFYGRRFGRVYPLHLVTALIAAALIPVIGGAIAAGPTVANLLLVHAWIPTEGYGDSLNLVSWSLACEAFFYATFPFMVPVLARLRPWRAMAGILAAMAGAGFVVWMTLPADVAERFLYKSPLFRWGEFLLGICVALLVRSGWRPPVRLPGALAVAAGSYLAVIVLAWLFHNVGGTGLLRAVPDTLMLPAFGLLIAAAAADSIEGRSAWAQQRWLVVLGEASFALYMTHYLLFQILEETAAGAPGPVLFVVAVVLAVIVSLLFWRGVEHPLERILRQRLGSSRRRVDDPL